MYMVKGANNSMVRTENKRLIREQIFNGPVTKQELVARLQLSLSTVTTALKELEAEGFIKKDGHTQSTGGRRADRIVFN